MAGLIDIHGNSLRLQKEPQTENDAKLAQLRRHYSEHPTVGLTPGKAAAALKEAEEGASSPSASWPKTWRRRTPICRASLASGAAPLLGVSWTMSRPAMLPRRAARLRDDPGTLGGLHLVG